MDQTVIAEQTIYGDGEQPEAPSLLEEPDSGLAINGHDYLLEDDSTVPEVIS